MKFKLIISSLMLVTLCYFANSLISEKPKNNQTAGAPVKIVINGSVYSTFHQTHSTKSTRSQMETEAMDAVVRLAHLPQEERLIQYQNIIAKDNEYGRMVKYLYEHGHLPDRSGIGSFLDVPMIYDFFSGRTPRDAFEQAHLRSALKYYREPLTKMKDPNGMDRLAPAQPGDSSCSGI